MLPIRTLAVIIFFLGLTAAGQTSEQYTGKLDSLLQPDMVHIYRRVYSLIPDISMIHSAVPIEKGSVIRIGPLIDERVSSGTTKMLLIEPPAGSPYLLIDANGNGNFEANERFSFENTSETTKLPEIVVRLPIQSQFYKDYPVFIRYLKDLRNTRSSNDRLVEQSVYALAYGHVDVGVRRVLFQYPFEPSRPAISTTEGLFGVDSDGNGTILNQQFSRETSYAAESEIVLPLGDMFVSTSTIDMTTGKITVRRRDKSEYTRIDLEVGKEMPDFAFTDFEGKPRHLSDFRGKYLMVDFWGAWCGDCTRETPFHLDAYERFKKRGFEILGLDSDEKIETAKAYLTENKIMWPQATFASIKNLANVDYRIQEYPSTILLGPDGKVIVLDQHELQGKRLSLTLDKLLPR